MQRKDNIRYKTAVEFKPPINLKTQPIIKPKFIDVIKQGFSFGLGSTIAHNTVNSISKSMSSNSCDKIFEKCKHDKDCSTEEYLRLEKEFNICILQRRLF